DGQGHRHDLRGFVPLAQGQRAGTLTRVAPSPLAARAAQVAGELDVDRRPLGEPPGRHGDPVQHVRATLVVDRLRDLTEYLSHVKKNVPPNLPRRNLRRAER